MPTHYHYPDAPPLESFDSLLETASLELQKSKQFLQRVEGTPHLLFKEAHIYLRSARNIVTSVMSVPHLKNDQATPHAFLIYLATLLDREFKEWAKTQDWKHDISILVRQPNSFPSIFAVYVDEREVLQFNIFERWYGVREKFHTEEELMEHYQKSEKRTLSDIKKSDKKIVYWKDVQAKPWSFIKTVEDIYIFLFKRETLNQNIEKKIVSLERNIGHMMQDLVIQRESIAETLERQEKAFTIAERMRVFFVELEYTLNEEIQQLY